MKNFTLLIAIFIGFLQISTAQTVAEVIADSPVHNTLETAISAADLSSTLDSPGSFTVFAPTDAAFQALPEGTIPSLLANLEGLTSLLLTHVLGTVENSEALFDGRILNSLSGEDLTVSVTDAGIFINGVLVSFANITATNGIVHVIDAVLLSSPVVPPINSCYPSRVLSFVPRKQNDGSDISETRLNPNNALGMPENSDAPTSEDNVNFVSLGFGGEIILGFDAAIRNGEGDDIIVYETTFNSGPNNDCRRWPERIDVFASQDSCNWVYLGRECQDASFDLGTLSWAKYLRIRDVSNPSGGSFSNIADDGYNLDGVSCVHGTIDNLVMDNLVAGYATEVKNYEPRPRANGTPIADSRDNPEEALGMPQNTNAVNFVALGFGGSIELKFDFAIFDGEGSELSIVETSYGNPACNSYPERAAIEGSLDGENWVELTTTPLCHDGLVDINSAGVIHYIRVTDRSAASSFSGSADGYDLDAVVVLNSGCGQLVNDENRIADNTLTPDETSSSSVYPNPFNSLINLELTTGDQDHTALIEISNFLGQNLSSERINVAISSKVLHQINAEKLSKGIYLITVTTNSSKETFKLVKN
ncbi:MAG: fasciclin domain-containing protein [Bacteroidia bacterium]